MFSAVAPVFKRSFSSLKRVPLPPPRNPPQVRHSRGVPCSASQALPELTHPPKEDFPRGYVVDKSAFETVEDFALEARRVLDNELTDARCVVFRNSPVDSSLQFSDFLTHLGFRTQDYLHFIKAMGARSMQSTQVTSAVRTASDEPPEWCIEPHCEYHTAGLPAKIILYCDKPAAEAGETILSDNRQVYKDLRPDVREKFESLGVQYIVYYKSQESSVYNHWQGNISPDKKIVEEYLENLDYQFEWLEGDALKYWKTIPVTAEHEETGEVTWFNQLHAHHRTFYQGHPTFAGKELDENFAEWPVDTRYGDGTPIEPEVLEHVREVVWKNTIALDLHHGDIVVADNKLCKHGRMPFTPGSDRKVYVGVCYD